jgi:hypothetical protein
MLKLDLGAGPVSPLGFTPLGRGHGSEIFPLRYADESVDEIRASHCLEHFPHGQVEAVVRDWARCLKKRGKLKIAVPDFAQIAQNYLEGKYQPTEGYVVGGQVDANDFHKAMFDRDRLRALLAGAGLVLTEPWQSEIQDCAALPISLNLAARKPHVSQLKVSGCMSVPRLGFMDNFFSAVEAVIPCGIKLRKHGGAFWGQSMTKVFEKTIEEDDPDLILAIDYDSIMTPGHMARMIRVDRAFRPDVAAHQETLGDGKALVSFGPVAGRRLGRGSYRRGHRVLAQVGTRRQHSAPGEPRGHRPC